MRILRTLAVAVAVLLPAVAVAGHEFPVPSPLATPTTPVGQLTVWPYTSSDFSDPHAPEAADPVNLIFLNTDPRAVRQALISLPPLVPGDPVAGCQWFDAMGYEQAAYGEPEGWVGGTIQLACYTAGQNPLGNPSRFHIRLFRIGEHTLGAAHFEVLITNTAEHEVLSWNFARQFVVGALMAAQAQPAGMASLVPGMTSFRAVRRPVYAGLAANPKTAPLLAILGLVPLPSPPAEPDADVPIPCDGAAVLIAPGLVHQPVKYDVTTTIPAVPYDIVLPKPFCNDQGSEFVRLLGGLEFRMRVRTNRSGQYLRTYELGGTLKVTALTGPDAGKTFDAVISERHRAMLTDEYDQVTELASQLLVRKPPQLLGWVFAVGHQDGYLKETVCGF